MARGFTNSEARDLVERSSALLEEFSAAAQLSETRHTELAQIVRETRSRKVDARFSDVVIRQAGENTYEVLDINPLGAITLDQLNGIENPSLVQIADGLETHTLAECQQRAFEGTRINLDGPHGAAANAVLHAAFVSANSYQPAAICKHAADAYGPHVQALVEKIEAGSGTFKRLFASRDKKDEAEFLKYAAEENLEATEVAVVTEDPRLVLSWRGKEIVNISRAFLDTNGAHQIGRAHV